MVRLSDRAAPTAFMRNSRLIAIIAISLCLFVTAETAVRLIERIRYGAPMLANYDEDGTLFASNILGKSGSPRAKFKECRLNSLGLRGSEPQPDTRRILLIGSSEVFGFCESLDPDLPQQLQYELGRAYGDGRYDVLNVSYPETRLNDLTAYATRVADRTRPFLAFIYPSPATYIHIQIPQVRSESASKQLIALRLIPYLKWSFRNLVPIRVRALMYSQMVRHAAGVTATASHVPAENTSRYVSELDVLVRELQSRGIKPILLTHATPFSEPLTTNDRAMLVNWRRYYPSLLESGFLDMELSFNEATRAYATRHELTVVDVGSALRGCRECFVDFTHFSALGSRRVAGLLATELEQEQPTAIVK